MDKNKNNDDENIIIESDRYDSKYINDEPHQNKTSENNDNEKKSKKIKKNKQKRKFTFYLKWFAICLLIITLLGGGVGAALLYSWIKDSPQLDLSLFEYPEPTALVDKNGDPYQDLQGSEKRENIEMKNIPDKVKYAFIDIEDERFETHKGVDIQGLVRAGLSVVTSQSLTGPGGSTITQQLIKLTQLDRAGLITEQGYAEKTVKRKAIEMYLAVQLERQYTKDQILEAYLNKVGFAYAWGVQAAAETYFGKGVQDISVAQSAVLAAIIKSPTYYKPYIIDEVDENVYEISKDEDGKIVYNEKNQTRALAVIRKMYELGHITQEEKDEATEQLKNNDFGLQEPPENNVYTYFTDALYENVLDDLMNSDNFAFDSRDEAENYLLNSGLKIYTTVDPKIQSVLDEKFADDSLFPPQSNTAKTASRLLTEERGEKVSLTPEGAVTIVENSTGHVVGMVGGREEKKKSRSMNRATTGFQVGSSTKPLTVYGPGLETKSITLASTFDDVPIKIGSKKVSNSPNTYDGMITVRKGLTQSKNTVAIQSLYTLGVSNSIKYAEMLGLNITEASSGDEGRNDENFSSMALGGYTNGQSTVAMASAFSTFPNMGTKIEPVMYTRIEDRDGNTVLENKQDKEQVFSPQTSFLITDVLKDVVKSGGTTNLSVSGVQIAGKTGTTNDQMYAYFCGYTNEYTAAVWYGYDYQYVTVGADENGKGGKKYYLNINKYGGESSDSPAKMWETIMRSVYKDGPSSSLPGNPGGIVSASVDRVSGKKPTELSAKDPRGSTVISEMFLPGTVPSAPDDYHVEVSMDMSTGKIATEFCPKDLVENVVRIKKPSDRFPNPVKPQNSNYVPKSEAGVLAPADDDMCTVHNASSSLGITILKDNSPVDEITLEVGKAQQVKVVGTDRNNQYTQVNDISMTSDNDNVTISKAGTPGVFTITAAKGGTSTVTASMNLKYTVTVGDKKEERTMTYSDSLKVNVNAPAVAPIVTFAPGTQTSMTLNSGASFSNPKIYVNGQETNSYTRTITKNGQVVQSIDTSTDGTYIVVYKVTINGLTGSRQLEVTVQGNGGQQSPANPQAQSQNIGFIDLFKFLFS